MKPPLQGGVLLNQMTVGGCQTIMPKFLTLSGEIYKHFVQAGNQAIVLETMYIYLSSQSLSNVYCARMYSSKPAVDAEHSQLFLDTQTMINIQCPIFF